VKDEPITSPVSINPAASNPSEHHRGTFLRKWPFVVAGLVFAGVVLMAIYIISQKGQPTNSQGGEAAESGPSADAIRSSVGNDDPPVPLDILQGVEADEGGYVAPVAPEPVPVVSYNQTPVVRDPVLEARRAAEARMIEFKMQQEIAAMSADIGVSVDTSEPESSQLSVAQRNIELAREKQQLLLNESEGALGGPSLSGQQMNQAFADGQGADVIGYLPHTRETAKFTTELRVGTIIPATLISGINSDLPGSILAQVDQNVYDSATGRHLLIPQGAQLYGLYNSSVSFGQDRVQTAWRRLNYPDGSKLELGKMAGMDVQGYSGHSDQVDNHYWATFGNALLLGLISGSVQSGVSDNNSDNRSTGESIADGVTQQFAQTGSSLIQKNLDVQPTIKIRPGMKFNIMINQDIALPPYTAGK
jgi:type IV secretion system protein VirB10